MRVRLEKEKEGLQGGRNKGRKRRKKTVLFASVPGLAQGPMHSSRGILKSAAD